ncbi:uncharacterized protein LOC135835635 [Planococcus citri]|uniref:uncharacterized protein LOC135835635 n=1 Tax=Planococcus citri TaxID=170843 RepID=UPI0031F9EAE8
MLKIRVIYFLFLILSLHSITAVKENFNLEEGKRLTKGIFEKISRLFGNSIDYKSTIDGAENVNQLLSKADGILTPFQDDSIVEMARGNRKDFQQTLKTFINEFNALFAQAKEASATDQKSEEPEESEESEEPPLQYLMDMINKKED